MALKKQKKTEIVSTLDASLKDAQSVVFVKFDKLTVADVNTLRRNLQKEDIGYMVAKKTLLKRALATRGIEGELPELPGQIAVAYGTDLLAPAREVYAFQKGHKENISIVGGMFEGKYMDKVQMESIATIPPREVLLSQIAYLLKSPLQRLAIAVNAVAGTK
ncbi:MAG: 50S ribosomal protein L10 [Candidatus Pacebacteria bacterium]|jgi:large subunit ribosomal protein L10|nr:50S ribosomal protein L10 [Candidatus Paceibacterota bacterium]